jgi:integrase
MPAAAIPAQPPDIDAFFAAATALQIASPWRWQAAAFFTLMHSCGLRTCEVRRLRAAEVDFEDEHIDIIWSKGNRSRRLPITPDVMQVLDACDTESRARFPGRSHFFVSATGNQVDPATTGKMFARIWDQAGLTRPVNGRQPVPYALRHHFAYACIERWRIQGMDITAMLPYLSAYMGHSSFAGTYYYIHTSPDFLAAYDDITTASQDMLPEVGWGE